MPRLSVRFKMACGAGQKQNLQGSSRNIQIPIVPPKLTPRLKLIGRKVRPSREEVARNPRARSALLRVAEKAA